jgi:hypothetical protein
MFRIGYTELCVISLVCYVSPYGCGGASRPRAYYNPSWDGFLLHYNGQCHLIDNASLVYSEAQSLAKKHDGYYMDQFTFAERATDWRGNNNIAESLFSQMEQEQKPIPAWVVKLIHIISIVFFCKRLCF